MQTYLYICIACTLNTDILDIIISTTTLNVSSIINKKYARHKITYEEAPLHPTKFIMKFYTITSDHTN